MAETNGADPRTVVLEDGRELRIDLNAISWAEYRELARGVDYDSDEGVARFDALLSKVVGEDAGNLGALDHRLVVRRVHEIYADPVKADPN